MKKLLTLLILTAYSCGAQNIEPLEPVLIEVPLSVLYINADEMGLFSKETGRTYKVDPQEVEVEKVYWFWINVVPCANCKTQTGSVLDFEITPDQANRNIVEKRQRIRLNQLQ